MLTGGGEGDGPQEVAEQAVAAINKNEPDIMRDAVCDTDKFDALLPDDVETGGPVRNEVELAGRPEVDGSKATAIIQNTTDPAHENKQQVDMRKSDDGWCIDYPLSQQPG